MKNSLAVLVSLGCLLLGAGLALASKASGPGMDLIRGKPPQEAGLAALAEAQKLAGSGTWEQIAVARVYYLSGNKAQGQSIIDRVLAGKSDHNDWQRIGQLYADAGENDKAAQFFERAVAADPKDDTGQSEIGAWYISIGQRDKGEELLAKAFARNPDEGSHYLRAAQAYLKVPPR
jgi:tetratricopeptide (TPR) repeat protein